MFVKYDNIVKYAKSTPSSRNMIEGERIINSQGMIIMCGLTKKTDQLINIFGLCLRTSGLTENPHEISGELLIKIAETPTDANNNVSSLEIRPDEENNINMSCTCNAGVYCKHIVAILLFCNRYNKNLSK